MNDAISLSVIVVALNERAHLPRLKSSIDQLDRPEGFAVETILVDGGSRDGTPALARELGFTQVLVEPGANIPVCRNRGMRAAKGAWLAFVDADCELARDWLTHLDPFLKKGEPIILGWPVMPPQPATWVQHAWHIHWTRKQPALEETDVAGYPAIRREAFRLITTRNMILHRSVGERLNGFDEELPTGEDTDFVFRAYLEGIPLYALPSLHAVHHGEPATLRAFFRQQIWHANRLSYQRIFARTKGRIGGNAPLFTILFAASAIIAGGALMAFLTTFRPWFLLGLVPLAAVVGGPALIISVRARSPQWLPALCALYGAYGLARSLNLLGGFQSKPSWKRKEAAK